MVGKSRAPSNGSSTKLPQGGGWHQGGAGPAEGPLRTLFHSLHSGPVTAPHRRYTLSGSPESPEARLPRGRGACHLRPSLRCQPLPCPSSRVPQATKRSSCTCLIGLWGPSSSLVSPGLRWKVLSSAGWCTGSGRMSPLVKRSAAQKGSRGCQAHWGIWSRRGLGQHLLGGRGRVLGSCPGHWELLFGGAWRWCTLEDKGGATGRDGGRDPPTQKVSCSLRRPRPSPEVLGCCVGSGHGRYTSGHHPCQLRRLCSLGRWQVWCLQPAVPQDEKGGDMPASPLPHPPGSQPSLPGDAPEVPGLESTCQGRAVLSPVWTQSS